MLKQSNLLMKTIILVGVIMALGFGMHYDWGFYGHRKINKMAVYTLPPPLNTFYKKNIEYISDHAVDPDKRRYSTKGEGVKHYIDIDHWDTIPFPDVPRDLFGAVKKYGYFKNKNGKIEVEDSIQNKIIGDYVKTKHLRTDVIFEFAEFEWSERNSKYTDLIFVDSFSQFGVVPFNCEKMTKQLEYAFMKKDVNRILRLSAELGHYVGDASVPLHTTENYNGQMTDQVGIHAFWESRIPELFAEDEFDFFVGKAEYINDPNTYFWDVVTQSHALVGDVFKIEKELSIGYDQDKLYCYDERLGRMVRTQCRKYARTYNDALDNTVEQRMRDAVLSIGSVWYTAWVNAGQPDLSDVEYVEEEETEIKPAEDVKSRGHEH